MTERDGLEGQREEVVGAHVVTHHLVGTYDGTTVCFYLDGTLQGTGAAPISGTIATGTFPLRLGFNAGANANPLDGAVDEVQLFTTALTATEVAAFYASY